MHNFINFLWGLRIWEFQNGIFMYIFEVLLKTVGIAMRDITLMRMHTHSHTHTHIYIYIYHSV